MRRHLLYPFFQLDAATWRCTAITVVAYGPQHQLVERGYASGTTLTVNHGRGANNNGNPAIRDEKPAQKGPGSARKVEPALMQGATQGQVFGNQIQCRIVDATPVEVG